MTDPYAAAVRGAAGRSLQLEHILGTLLRQAPDVEAAAVVSFDGLPMASALPASMDEDRVAAMSAALLSLGERAAQGLGRGDLSQVYVEGDSGTVFLVSADDEAVLVAVGRAGAKVGLILFEIRQAAGAVGTALRVEPLAPAPVTDVPAPSTNGHHESIPSVMPDPPTAPEPQHHAVAVPVPREVGESSWDQSPAGTEPAVDRVTGPAADPRSEGRRRATVAPDGSPWS